MHPVMINFRLKSWVTLEPSPQILFPPLLETLYIVTFQNYTGGKGWQIKQEGPVTTAELSHVTDLGMV